MTLFDWILVIIASPWLILNVVGAALLLITSERMRATTGRTSTISLSWGFFAPFVLLLIVAYRIWG